MCIIAVSKRGIRQPTLQQLQKMFNNNPDGAGYMFARDGKVAIHKGFMTWEDFKRAVMAEKFTEADPVVYHFRISTQAGIKPTMTHPFPLTDNIKLCEKLDVLSCPVGIAHNGIIHLTTDHKQTRFSDTALFIAEYMTKLIRHPSDMHDESIREMIYALTNSKWALLEGKTGEIETVGAFINHKGLLFSNTSYKTADWTPVMTKGPGPHWHWDDLMKTWEWVSE